MVTIYDMNHVTSEKRWTFVKKTGRKEFKSTGGLSEWGWDGWKRVLNVKLKLMNMQWKFCGLNKHDKIPAK